jgi:hypothetical protein
MSNPQATQLSVSPESEHTVSLSQLTSLLIKHFDVKEGLYEASFGLGIMVGGFQPAPTGTSFPGTAVVIQNVSLVPVSSPTAHSVDASTVR